jgi:hypothetical protein
MDIVVKNVLLSLMIEMVEHAISVMKHTEGIVTSQCLTRVARGTRKEEKMSEQPKASVQYQDYKKWPKTYREPTSEEWDKELSDLRTQLAEAQGEIGRMNISLELQADRVDKLIDENVKAEADNAELKTEIERRNSKTWCAYCGFEIDIDDEASTKISEHIMSCPKPPLRRYERHSEALEAENAALRERLKKVEEVYNENKNEENGGFNEEMKNVFWQAIKAACEA